MSYFVMFGFNFCFFRFIRSEHFIYFDLLNEKCRVISFMSYCPNCGNKVDETMTFCPRCGASLKAGTASQGSPTARDYRYRYERHEKHNEKAEKRGEKHEKSGGGFGYLVAGILIVLLGVLAFINATTTVFSGLSGPVASAL